MKFGDVAASLANTHLIGSKLITQISEEEFRFVWDEHPSYIEKHGVAVMKGVRAPRDIDVSDRDACYDFILNTVGFKQYRTEVILKDKISILTKEFITETDKYIEEELKGMLRDETGAPMCFITESLKYWDWIGDYRNIKVGIPGSLYGHREIKVDINKYADYLTGDFYSYVQLIMRDDVEETAEALGMLLQRVEDFMEMISPKTEGWDVFE